MNSKRPDKHKVNSKPEGRRPSLKQERFVESYLANGGNATQAAKNAGYKGSEETLRAVASENLTKPNIKARINARLADAGVTSTEVIGTLASQMRADFADFMPEHPIVKAANAAGVSHLIKKVTQRTWWDRSLNDGAGAHVEETSIELHNSQAAAKQLCAVLGLNKAEAPNPYDAAQEAVNDLVREFGLKKERAAELVAKQFGMEASELIN